MLEKFIIICYFFIFDVHYMHRIIKIKKLNNIIQGRNNDYKQYFDEEQIILEVYNEHELKRKSLQIKKGYHQ